MVEQVPIRLRRAGKKATVVSIHVGYPNRKIKNQSTHKKIEPTNQTDTLTNVVLQLFRQKYSSGAVRNVAVNYSGLVDESFELVSLFDDVEKIEKEERLQSAIYSIWVHFTLKSQCA